MYYNAKVNIWGMAKKWTHSSRALDMLIVPG